VPPPSSAFDPFFGLLLAITVRCGLSGTRLREASSRKGRDLQGINWQMALLLGLRTGPGSPGDGAKQGWGPEAEALSGLRESLDYSC